MRSNLRLARIGGIPVELNVGVLVIVVVICLGLAFGRLPVAAPGLSVWAYLAAGAVAAVLFVASLLAHELAHALVAGRSGMAVDGITLWLFGGVARLRGQARTPGREFTVAVVGPATSVALGGIFGAATVGLYLAGVHLPTAVAGYLAVVNLALTVFNLVPTAPLDGGRVLRALVWRISGDRFRARGAPGPAGGPDAGGHRLPAGPGCRPPYRGSRW